MTSNPERRRRTTATLILLATTGLLAGCGADEPETERDLEGIGGVITGETPTAEAEPAGDVVGTLYVRDFGNVRVRPNSSGAKCSAPTSTAQGIRVGDEPIVIRDPDGSEVALARLTSAEVETFEDGGSTFAEPDICVFTFTADIDLGDGVYTAVAPDLDTETRFTAEDAGDIELRYEP